MSACSSQPEVDEKPESSLSVTAPPSSASKPADDPSDTAKTEAIGTYKSYWQEMQQAYAKASIDGTDIKKYAAGPALSRAEQDSKSMQKSGRVVTGEVTVGSPTATKIDLNRKVPNVTISSCLDTSGWRVIDRDTNKPVAMPTERLTKYVIVATVERWKEGWKVIKDEPQERAC